MMLLLKLIAIVALWLYAGALLYAAIGFWRSHFFTSRLEHKNFTRVTVVIPARNEEANIEACLSSILSQEFDFSLLQIIVVNDASNDKTLEITERVLSQSGINHLIISNQTQEGKKKSLTKAIESADGSLIITRDADTYTTSNRWLKTIVDFHEVTKKEFIIAPVRYENKNGLLSQIQYFENLGLSILTGGYAAYKKAFLCSGANLAFTKSVFRSTNGYSNHLNIASGDDVLFLEEVKKVKPETIVYLKQNDATVITYPEKNLRNLAFQKIRWASKIGQNSNNFNAFLGILVLFIHVFTVFSLFVLLFRQHISAFGIIFILGRFLIDYLLLFLASRYFKQDLKWWWFLPAGLIYSVFVSITAILSLLIKPNWK